MDINLINEIIEFYIEKGELPKESDITLSDTIIDLPSFITIYKGWKIAWNSWNIKESNEESFWDMLVSNTIEAFKESKISEEEAKQIKIRVDFIEEKLKLTWKKKIKDINPTSKWVIVIKADYSTASVILPNISDKIASGVDLEKALETKIKNFKEDDFIIYELKTKQITNF